MPALMAPLDGHRERRTPPHQVRKRIQCDARSCLAHTINQCPTAAGRSLPFYYSLPYLGTPQQAVSCSRDIWMGSPHSIWRAGVLEVPRNRIRSSRVHTHRLCPRIVDGEEWATHQVHHFWGRSARKEERNRVKCFKGRGRQLGDKRKGPEIDSSWEWVRAAEWKQR